jgi:hypothetical protein
VSATVEPGDAAIYTARGHSRLAPLWTGPTISSLQTERQFVLWA